MKTCTRCKEHKPLSEFHRQNIQSCGYYPQCKACRSRYDKKRRTGEAWTKRLAQKRDYHRRNPEVAMWYEAKKRAKQRRLPFAIERTDIVIPQYCPVLGVKLVVSETGVGHEASPSLDAIDPARGYVKGNVQVISRLANTMKNKATVDQLITFAFWVLEIFSDRKAA